MTRRAPMYVSNAQVPHGADSREGHRVLFVLGIAGVIALSLVVAAWQHVEALRYGYRLNQLVRERERLEALKRQLELERAYYRSPQVIEPLARRLGLIRPDPSQVIVVGRGAPPLGREEHRMESPAEVRTPIEMRQVPTPVSVRSENAHAPRRRLRAIPTGPGGDRAEVRAAEPRTRSATASENPEALSVKGSAPSDGISHREGLGEEAPQSADPTPKRRRPSKQGEP